MIISDYSMPGMTGLEFLELIRKNPLLARVGFFMLSGSGEVELVRRAEKLGASGYIVKPFSYNDLKTKLDDLFGRLAGVNQAT